MHVFNLGLTDLEKGQNSSKSQTNRFPFLTLRWVPKSTFKLNFKKVDTSAYFQPWFDQPCTRAKIALNLIKIGIHAYLLNGYLNPLSKLNSEKVNKSASFQPWFDQP